MVNGVITEGNNCIYSMGKTEGQYKGQRRLLCSEAIELKGVNEFTSQRGSKNLEGQKVVFVPVDGSEIKQEAREFNEGKGLRWATDKRI